MKIKTFAIFCLTLSSVFILNTTKVYACVPIPWDQVDFSFIEQDYTASDSNYAQLFDQFSTEPYEILGVKKIETIEVENAENHFQGSTGLIVKTWGNIEYDQEPFIQAELRDKSDEQPKVSGLCYLPESNGPDLGTISYELVTEGGVSELYNYGEVNQADLSLDEIFDTTDTNED